MTPPSPEPFQDYRLPLRPEDVPGLVAFWDFQDDGPDRATAAGEPYRLRVAGRGVERVETEGNPWGPYAMRVAEGGYLVCPRAACPRLDIHGPGRRLTVLAWLRRERVASRHCEFIAGQWNETNRSRQYGLFLDIGVWGGRDQVCAHLSPLGHGGPTPGYRYCIDAAVGATPVEHDRWCCVALSYDGVFGYAWLNGVLDRRDGLNPYPLAGGLHDGGPAGSDFTVGAVDRSGEMGNFFTGLLGGLAVYDRALTPAQMHALAFPHGP